MKKMKEKEKKDQFLNKIKESEKKKALKDEENYELQKIKQTSAIEKENARIKVINFKKLIILKK